ncbi:MAG TPA: oligosaccharide flippase family protein [Pirellulales bacterium]|nr:oligosaccharide flippase family protein [Pirellulales bacterium]
MVDDRKSTGHRAVAFNVAWNWAGMLVQMAAGFVVAPYLVHHLGEATYAIWILIGSLAGYFGLLDLGVRGAVGRNMAFRRAQGDAEGMNAILYTALTILCICAFAIVLTTCAASMLFFILFDVPPEYVASTRGALFIIGMNLAIVFPGSVFDAALWSQQRFDLINLTEIPAAIARTVLSVYVVAAGHDLMALALVTFSVTLVSVSVKCALVVQRGGFSRFRRRFLTWDATRCLYGYGIWHFLLSSIRVLLPQVGSLVIGSQLAIRLVTPYSIALRLVGYVTSMVIAATGVLTPVTTAMHARANEARLRQVFLQGGLCCCSFALFSLSGLAIMAGPLITLWMGADFDTVAARVLLVAAAGEALPMSQWVTHSIVLGMGRHRFWACTSVIELLLSVVFSLSLASPFGLVGIAVAFALPAAIFRGLLQLRYGCQLLHCPLGMYWREATLPALLGTLPAIAGLTVLMHLRPAGTWPEICIYSALYVGIFLATCAVVPGFADLRARGIGLLKAAG